MRPARAGLQCIAILLLLAGCGHSDPFGPTPPERGPLESTPLRLTFNIRADKVHGYSAQGNELYYTYCADAKTELNPPCGEVHQPDLPVAEGDRCLGALPAESGSRLVELCGSPTADRDSIKQFRTGTRLADGTLAFIYATRTTTASFSVNPALYLWPEGSHAPVRVLEYRAAPADLGIPERLVSAGGMNLIAYGGDGTELLTVGTDLEITRTRMAGLLAADVRTGRLLVEEGGALHSVDPASGNSMQIGSVTPEAGWIETTIEAAGMANGHAVVLQRSWRQPGASVEVRRRLVLFGEGTADTLFTVNSDQSLAGFALAPDGQSLIYEQAGDLFRLNLP